MRGRLCRIAFGALIGAGALSGCVQMTRHSNTMVFGTNTSFGIKVGADASATPGITVGYSRQEAVIMPLVANTGGTPEGLLPCPVGSDGELPANCLLVGRSGSDEAGRRDAYSVFASFGTKFAGNASTREANGQIAQYFATGVAAQRLAEAGPATVALGAAASTSSQPEVQAIITAQSKGSEAVAKKIEQTDANGLAGLLGRIDTAALTDRFTRACTKADGSLMSSTDCAAAVRARDRLGGLPSGKWDAAGVESNK